MKKSHLLGAACLTIVSFNASASVVNNLNGIDYEWLELTVTAGQSRDAVQAQIDAASLGDALYGYEYASRGLVEDLLYTYSPWDGANGWHGASAVATGMDNFLDDFGRITTVAGDGSDSSFNTGDGFTIQWDSSANSYGLYGATDECGVDTSCVFEANVGYNAAGNPTAAEQSGNQGWDATAVTLNRSNSQGNITTGSLLVRTTVVPIPAAVWLFGSGLLGLIGMARRKTA